MVRDVYNRIENEWVPVKKPKSKTGDHTYSVPKVNLTPGSLTSALRCQSTEIRVTESPLFFKGL